ncbi:MAG: hypothetical protein ACTS45_00800 [Candidatus Hodgkinia cicadicola]
MSGGVSSLSLKVKLLPHFKWLISFAWFVKIHGSREQLIVRGLIQSSDDFRVDVCFQTI